MIYGKYKKTTSNLKGNDHFEGMSIEREMELATTQGVQIDRNMTQIFYTQRKDGALPECDIRTDRFQLGQDAMDKANKDFKQAIQNKINPKETQKSE